MIDDSDLDIDIKNQIQQFSWSLESASEKEIKIQLSFKYPQAYNGEQYVTVKAIFSDFEPGWDDEKELTRTTIPK